jgi:hypothetical protein
MNLPTTTILLNWRRKTNKSGKYPVHIRIMINRACKYYPIPIPEKISLPQWAGKDDYWV